MNQDLHDKLLADRGEKHEPSIDRVIDTQTKQSKRKQLHCATFTTSLDASNMPQGLYYSIFPLGIHLPEEADIGSLYLENHSGFILNILEGPGGVGRIIGIANANTYRVIAVADNIASVSIIANTQTVTGVTGGLLIATLFTHKWAPKMGSIV